MIGWKILCTFDEKEVVCEVVGQVAVDDGYCYIPVYHNDHIKMAGFDRDEEVKVIERK